MTEEVNASPRRRRRRSHGGVGPSTAAKTQPRLCFRPVPAVSEDALEAIHQASLTILEDVGMDVLHDEARAILQNAGADVAGGAERVRFDRGLVESQIGKAPERFTLHGRVPARNVEIGGDYLAYCAVASAPNCADLEGGRRSGTRADFQNFIRLGQTQDAIHIWGGYPVEHSDIHASIRHLDA